jgi:SAM-dependent methyltransferase
MSWMSGNLWDAYGKWDGIANLASTDDVKRQISGNRIWRSNFVPPALQYVFNYALEEAVVDKVAKPSALDFGCGLGRNAPMLRHFFPSLIGYDLPEMAARLQSEYSDVFALYANVHTSLDALKSADLCVVYDSVVLQHIINRTYVDEVLTALLTKKSLKTFVSVYNNNSSINTENPHYPHLQILAEKGWKIWHREIETLSFEGSPHAIAVLRRS